GNLTLDARLDPDAGDPRVVRVLGAARIPRLLPEDDLVVLEQLDAAVAGVELAGEALLLLLVEKPRHLLRDGWRRVGLDLEDGGTTRALADAFLRRHRALRLVAHVADAALLHR